MLMTISVGQCSSRPLCLLPYFWPPSSHEKSHSNLPLHQPALFHHVSMLSVESLHQHASVSSHWLNGDEINVVHPAQSWESTWGRRRSVPQKHLLWVSTTGHSWIQDTWLDGLLVSSCLVVPVLLLRRTLKCFTRGSDCSQACKASALAFVDWTHRVLKKQQDTGWQI